MASRTALSCTCIASSSSRGLSASALRLDAERKKLHQAEQDDDMATASFTGPVDQGGYLQEASETVASPRPAEGAKVPANETTVEVRPRKGPSYGRGSENSAKQQAAFLRIGKFVRTFAHGQHVPPWSLEPGNIHGRSPSYRLAPLQGPTRAKWRFSDPFLALGIDPRRETGNAGLIKQFLGNTGRIKSRAETGLSRPMQNSVKKSTLKARAFGITPWFSNLGAPTDAWDRERADKLLGGAKRTLPTKD